MKKLQSIAQLPTVPALYALYGGTDRGEHVAYIGITGNLHQRISQHLINRDSSVATGTSAACLNPDYVRRVNWWEGPQFEDKNKREAAEIVAFAIFNPVLRSRGRHTKNATKLSNSSDFVNQMKAILNGEPSGQLDIPTLAEALESIEALKNRVDAIEAQLKGKSR